MPRSFTTNFKTAAASKSAKPYQVLEIDWGGVTGTKYYLDRSSDSFTASGTRVPASGIGNSLVMQWPSVGIALNESQVGATSQTQVVLDDYSGEITAILNSTERQRKLVTLYRMFDDDSVVWGTDNALMATFSLRPFDWSSQDNQITLNLGDLGPLLGKSISFVATSDVFANVPQESQDKSIPLCWGVAQRVEALLVKKPWQTKILQGATGSESMTVKVDNHPSEFGITDGTVSDAWLGGDKVSITWNQSATPDTVPSTVTIAATASCVLLSGVVTASYGTGSDKYLTIADDRFRQFRLSEYAIKGDDVMVLTASGWSSTTLSAIQADYPWPGWVAIQLADSTLMTNITPSTPIKFMLPNSYRRIWEAGTILKAYDQEHIYAANALPSKGVLKVEGYGTLTDESGQSRKGFVPLGQYVGDALVGGVCTPNQYFDPFTVNLNDSTYAATLGNNITTVTFKTPPRDSQANLDDNRIWCTVLGVEDAGDSTGTLITNPADIILEYLQNSSLMNVDSSNIDSTSFSDAATSLSGYVSGFAQIESKDGLQLLQDLARQCHSCLFFDQDKATIVVLSDTAGTSQHTFDTTTNDNMLQGSLKHAEQDVDNLVNELDFQWRSFWDDKDGAKPLDVKDVYLTSQAAFGRMTKTVPIYMHFRREDVVTEIEFWLGHWGSIWRTVSFTAFLDALILQPGDWISVTWIDGGSRDLFSGVKTMQVTKTTDTGKDGLVEIEARYVQFTYS